MCIGVVWTGENWFWILDFHFPSCCVVWFLLRTFVLLGITCMSKEMELLLFEVCLEILQYGLILQMLSNCCIMSWLIIKSLCLNPWYINILEGKSPDITSNCYFRNCLLSVYLPYNWNWKHGYHIGSLASSLCLDLLLRLEVHSSASIFHFPLLLKFNNSTVGILFSYFFYQLTALSNLAQFSRLLSA